MQLCPQCELNYIKDGESICLTCSKPVLVNRRQKGFVPNKFNITNKVQKEFYEYMEKRGYSDCTPSGLTSTITAYLRSVDVIVAKENITWESLKDHISELLTKYDAGGSEEEHGAKSHRTTISALYVFAEFVQH